MLLRNLRRERGETLIEVAASCVLSCRMIPERAITRVEPWGIIARSQNDSHLWWTLRRTASSRHA